VTLRAISYGGGVQSTALLVLAAQRRIDYPLAIMANVGDDSEHPATLTYVRDVAVPYAAANGIELHLLDRTRRDGTTETLYGRLMRPGSRSLPIPVRMSNGAPGTRSCTADFKIRVTGKFLKSRGASSADPATVALGISLDEIQRANTRRAEKHEQIVYPLISIGDDTGLRMTRTDCQQLIAAAGLPVPPKSSCYFCPFHRPSAWQDMARDDPDLFTKAADLESTLNDRRDQLGKDHVYLTRFGVPLRAAIATDQPLLPLADADCDGGWCAT
jgi:3'-phosphoadenosine 5'-phosphosulfate sulfotransferase (PAPS reductase)/FAD synthetase